jgi:hypothetical protein
LALAAELVVTQSGGMEPDTYVISPADWAELLTENTAGRLNVDEGLLDGRALVRTTALTAGQMLVGACQALAVIGRKGGITVEGTQSHDVGFVSNVSTIRGASQIALGVLQPNAFARVGVV